MSFEEPVSPDIFQQQSEGDEDETGAGEDETGQLESVNDKRGASQESAEPPAQPSISAESPSQPSISALLGSLNISQEEDAEDDEDEDKADDCNNNTDKTGQNDDASYMPLHPTTKRKPRQPAASSTGLRRSTRANAGVPPKKYQDYQVSMRWLK